LTVEAEHLQQLADGIRAGLDRLEDAPPKPDPSSGG
jgi:hypothetical protein